MNKLLVLLGICVCFGSCSESDASTETAQRTTEEAVRANPVQEMLEVVEGQTVPTSSEALTLRIPAVSAKKDQEVCLPVIAEGFDQLIGLQYSITWNPEELAFARVQNFNLHGLNPSGFGQPASAPGTLTSLWIDSQLTGVSLADGSLLYELCFQAVGPVGSEAVVAFANGPTVFEVIDASQAFLRFKFANGTVRITD